MVVTTGFVVPVAGGATVVVGGTVAVGDATVVGATVVGATVVVAGAFVGFVGGVVTVLDEGLGRVVVPVGVGLVDVGSGVASGVVVPVGGTTTVEVGSVGGAAGRGVVERSVVGSAGARTARRSARASSVSTWSSSAEPSSEE